MTEFVEFFELEPPEDAVVEAKPYLGCYCRRLQEVVYFDEALWEAWSDADFPGSVEIRKSDTLEWIAHSLRD